ncbi:hypothetical protein BN8_00457 [Fibrisoma limi BUZ 3]|uniref:Uncharacterized protein n=1 Tax=Fibrisoma limi BUZ 3 TaxID=1185876 RepID=I2GCA5_9BACT|nr:hypothetical protein BN8_00457 [Fibrisoma limi BUZ 3]
MPEKSLIETFLASVEVSKSRQLTKNQDDILTSADR